MANLGNYPSKYLLFNSQLSKNLGIVLKIEGIPYLFGIADSYTQVRYGDAGLTYGLPGLVYGGLRRLTNVLPYMQLDQGLVIQQKIEPEQGRGNIGTVTVSLIDYNGLVSQIVSPGQFVPEIMGQPCTLYIGFTQTSWPEDYVILFRGYITAVTCPQGRVQLQISDFSSKSRQPIFDIASTELVAPVAATAAATGDVISLTNASVLHQQILGPNGSYDPTVATFLVADSEPMQYGPGCGLGTIPAPWYPTGVDTVGNTVLVARGQNMAASIVPPLTAHDIGATVNGAVGFGYNTTGDPANDGAGICGTELALKLLLSGWGGPNYNGYPINDIPIASFVPSYLTLPGLENFQAFALAASGLDANDALFDLGLTVGDYFFITGATGSGNNTSGQITEILQAPNGTNTVLLTNQLFTAESPTNAVVAFQSQYDTFPITCGVGCAPFEVDTPTFQAIQANYFTDPSASNLRIYFDSAEDCMDIIAQEIMLPLGCYSISRYGRVSMAITKPPLPGSGTQLVQLDFTNVIDPQNIVVTRATNQRSFYNEISYEYDYDVIDQTFNSIDYFLDSTSISEFNDVEILPIQSMGVNSEIGGGIIAAERGQALLDRFKDCLLWIDCTVNWTVGSLIEVSDVVLLVDNGNLQIMNFSTGQRNIGAQLFEVIDRTYSIVTGNVKLRLLGGLGFSASSRFGLVSPSTILNSGSTTTSLRLTPSFGQPTIANELAKWTPLVGQTIQVHDTAWSVSSTALCQGMNPSDPTAILVSPALAFAPTAGMILDIGPYNPDPSADTILKALYAYITPSVLVTSGISTSKFVVAASGASLINVGNAAIVRNASYSVLSDPDLVAGVTGTTVAMTTALSQNGSPFAASAGNYLEGNGFSDGTSSYLYG